MQLFFVFIFMNLSLIKSLILFLFGVFVIFQYYFEFNHVEKISSTTGIYLIIVLILYWIYKIFKTQQVHKYQDKYISYKYTELWGIFLVNLSILSIMFFWVWENALWNGILLFIKIIWYSLLPLWISLVSWGFWKFLLEKIDWFNEQNNVFKNIAAFTLGFSLFVFILVALWILGFLNIATCVIIVWIFWVFWWKKCLDFLSIMSTSEIKTQQTNTNSSYILSSEFFYFIAVLVVWVSLITIIRPFPIGWDDLGVYMNYPQLFAHAWEVSMLWWMHSWQVFTSIWYLFQSATQAFFLNAIGWIASFIFLWNIFQKYFSWDNVRQFVNIPLILSTIFISMPMVIFQQAKDIKHDAGLFFLSIGILYILFHILQSDNFSEYKTKALNFIWINNFNISSSLILFLVIWFVLGFTFTVKVTSLLLILWVFWVLFYAYFSYIGLFGYLCIFVWLFTKLWLWSYMNIIYSVENQKAISIFAIWSLLVWVVLLILAFIKKSAGVKIFLSKIFTLFIGIVIAILPWGLHNLASSDTFSISSIISGQPDRASVDYTKIYSPEEIQQKESEQEKFRLSATGSTWNEDWGRYLGYQEWVNNWIWLPYNLSMQENQWWEFTDISYLYFALLPLVLLFLPVRKKWLILPIAAIFIFEILLFFIPVTRELFQSFFALFTFPVGYLVLLLWFLIPFFILMLSVKNDNKTKILKFNLVFSLIYIFLWTISAYWVVWYGIVMYFNLLILIGFGLYYAMSFQVDDNQDIKQSKAIITLALMWVILSYFIFSVFPHSISNLKSAGYKEFKTWNISSVEAPYLYNPDYLEILFETNIHPDKQENFIDNALDIKVANYIKLLNEKNAEVKKKWEYTHINIYNIDQLESVLRQMRVSKNLEDIHSEISRSLEKIYTGISHPDEEYRNDKKIYRIGTFLKYYISQNNLRLFEDSLVMKFETYMLAGNPNATVKNMKDLWLEYFLVDLNAATIDKDPRRNLTKRFESLLHTFTSTDLELISSDSKCLMAARETYINSSKSPQDYVEYLAMAWVNYDWYENGEKISRTQKRIYCYNKVLNLIQEDKVDSKNYPYLLPIKNYLLQNPSVAADMQLLTAYLQRELPFGYKAFFKIK